MTLTSFEHNSRFDLAPWVGQRRATFRFTLVDGVTNQILRELTPIRDSVPTLTHDTSRSIPRTFDIELGASDTDIINPINNRVLPFMLIDGEEWPLGRYMFADSSQHKFTSGKLGSLSLVDEMFIVDQPIETGFSALVTASRSVTGFGDVVTSLEQVDQTARRLLREVNVFNIIDGTPFSSIGAWTVGTSRAQILSNLAQEGDYFPPWMDHLGILRMRRTFNPDRQVPDFNFDVTNKVYRESIVESNNLLTAANRIIVVSNGVTSDETSRAPVVGRFDIPSSAPHSIFNRGFVVPDVRTLQVESEVQAEMIARNIAITGTAFEKTELITPPDPRHDAFNVIRWDDKLWLEIAWSMSLIEGGDMRHTLQRIYA